MRSSRTHAARASAAYHAMQDHFYVDDGRSLYRDTSPWTGGQRYAYLWEFSRALVGTLAMAGIPRVLVDGADYSTAVADRFAALEHYWNPHAEPPAYDSAVISQGGGDRYYDDNVWVALALIQQYRMGLTGHLDRADQLFTFARSGWDTHPDHPQPGGVHWIAQDSGHGLSNHDRGTGATAANAELGYHLHLLTGSDNYDGDGSVSARPTSLGADNMLNWVATHVDATHNGSRGGLYWNAVRRDGTIDTNLWAYNQGVMIGAYVLRYQLRSEPRYLDRAAALANTALHSYDTFQDQPPPFTAMLFQNLLMSSPYATSGLQQRMRQSIEAYADWAWANPQARDPKTNLFYFDDGGRPIRGTGQPAQLRDQGAMTQVYALLAWNPATYNQLT